MNDLRPRVAVVDDDLSVRKALERLLRAAGFDAVTFASAHEFFYSLEAQHPDCLVLDLHMPGMNGLEVQRRLGQTGVRIPVVVITGHDEPQTRAQCLSAGATDYLCKPLNDEALLAAIQRAMDSTKHPAGRMEQY
jgi:FixJ family two-component response regulator